MTTQSPLIRFQESDKLTELLLNDKRMAVLVNTDSRNVAAIIKRHDTPTIFVDHLIHAILEDNTFEHIIDIRIEFDYHSNMFSITGDGEEENGEKYGFEYELSFTYVY